MFIKSKVLDEGLYYCKARIAPYGSHDDEMECMSKDLMMCSIIAVRMLLSICALMRGRKIKIDIKRAFLKTGADERDVFVAPPLGSKLKRFNWFLVVASYRLLNAYVISQHPSGHTFFILV